MSETTNGTGVAVTEAPIAPAPLNPALMDELIRQIAASLSPLISNEKWKSVIQAACEILEDINPQTATEGMLAVQIIVSHHMALKSGIHGAEFRNNAHFYLNQSNKFMRSSAMLIETLNHLRDKKASKQEIIVQHIYVNDGGQAIVGNVSPHEGGGNKKTGKPHEP